MATGEERAWEILAELDPADVCSRAKVAFNKHSGQYVLESFLQAVHISPEDKMVASHSSQGELLTGKLGKYYKLSALWYLINAQNIPLSGELVRPSTMRGGQIYLKGTHVLPLDRISEKYRDDVRGFLSRGKELGGEPLTYGDASLMLFPFPRVAVSIVLWKGDGEFSSRCDLLLDSTCELHMPTDIIWSTAMTSALMML